MKKTYRLTESELVDLIGKMIKEEDTTKKQIKKEYKKIKDFKDFAQSQTIYSAKLKENEKNIVQVMNPQSDEVVMEIDLGFEVIGSKVIGIKHDISKVSLIFK